MTRRENNPGGQPVCSFGEIIGWIGSLDVRSRNMCRVFLATQSHGAECFLEEELYPVIHSEMRRRVRVFGCIRRAPDGVTVNSVNVAMVELLPANDEIPDPLTLRGLLKDGPSLEEIREG